MYIDYSLPLDLTSLDLTSFSLFGFILHRFNLLAFNLRRLELSLRRVGFSYRRGFSLRRAAASLRWFNFRNSRQKFSDKLLLILYMLILEIQSNLKILKSNPIHPI